MNQRLKRGIDCKIANKDPGNQLKVERETRIYSDNINIYFGRKKYFWINYDLKKYAALINDFHHVLKRKFRLEEHFIQIYYSNFNFSRNFVNLAKSLSEENREEREEKIIIERMIVCHVVF